MKTILFFILLFSANSYALPIVNLNASDNQNITVYPDHEDPNLYYVAPIALRINRTEKGVPIFSFLEYKKNFRKKAIIQTTMSVRFADREISEMKKRILDKNPNARFSSIPFESSKIVFGNILNDFITESFCNHTGYISESEQVCAFIFNNKGRKIFRKAIRKHLLITLNFHFTISAVRELPGKKYELVHHTHAVAGRIGGEELSEFPELFRDRKGRMIQL